MGSTESNHDRKAIGIIGLGSIGVTHCLALKKLGIERVYALRTNKGSKAIPDDLNDLVKNVYSIEEFKEVDGFIIANPTSLHLASLKQLASFGKPIFIEKPLCSERELEQLDDLNVSHLFIQMGFCLRFHNVINKVKEIIDNNTLGAIHHARLNVGQYLPLWHPYTDYRTEYFSRSDLGGGAIKTLSHEIDLAQYFFGDPVSVKGFNTKLSDLEIDVDDYSLILLEYATSLVRIEVDFLSKKPGRDGKIFATNLDLYYDVFEGTIELYDKKGQLEARYTVEKNDIYFAQMQYFIDAINSGKKICEYPAANFADSVRQINLIKEVENYSNTNPWINIKNGQ